MVKSGWDKSWTSSLPELLTKDSGAACQAWIEELDAMPLAMCDALVSCQSPAEFWLDWHGCDGYLICGEHLYECIYEVNGQVSKGGVHCDICRKVIHILPRAMNWRPV